MAGKATKRSVYLPPKILREMLEEAAREDRSLSWIVQEVWLVAREELRKRPGTAPRPPPAPLEPKPAPVMTKPPPAPPPVVASPKPVQPRVTCMPPVAQAPRAPVRSLLDDLPDPLPRR
jgi:uncharacterized small protein (TIGR04563 family)